MKGFCVKLGSPELGKVEKVRKFLERKNPHVVVTHSDVLRFCINAAVIDDRPVRKRTVEAAAASARKRVESLMR